MRLIATYAGPYGKCSPCVRCGEHHEPGDRIYGDVDSGSIYCPRCAQEVSRTDGA